MQRLQTSVHRGNEKDPSDGAYTNCENAQRLLWVGFAEFGFLLWAGLALGWVALGWVVWVGSALGRVSFGWGQLWAGSALGGVSFELGWLWALG